METMALQNPTTVDLLLLLLLLYYYVICKGPTLIEIHRNRVPLRARLHLNWHYTWGPTTTLHDFGSDLDNLWALLLGSHNLRATPHTSLKAHDHCILRCIIGWNGRDRPRSLRTRRWRPKRPNNSWMRKFTWILIWQIMIDVSWYAEIYVVPTSWRWA